MRQMDRAARTAETGASLSFSYRFSRYGLLQTTALQAVAIALLAATQAHPSFAQLPPATAPAGGVVVAGQARIAQTANATTVVQATSRAVLNWQSFNVGAAHSVDFQQPSSSAVALNRVVGPNPSEIAGRIHANGTIVIVIQAGVVFSQGAQVDTAGLVVSAAGISNSNFMAGRMAFDQPAQPGAKIENRGRITIGDRGLAALVGPHVANSGTVQAKLGTVILAGAEAHRLDLYGDGMVGINVTQQVRTAADGTAALVTNTGIVTARGGIVTLTAEAVDGVVQTLVNAGGTIRANSAAARTGKVLISGKGGDVIVAGTVEAAGRGAGQTGGAIEVVSSGAVNLAQGARVNASGRAGGGKVAIGTTLARAAGGASAMGQPTAKTVTVASTASIAANATAAGNGGTVTLLSVDQTTMAGSIAAKGGPNGGDGGFVEVSGGVVALTGQVDATALKGAAGTLLLDPLDLYVSDAQPTVGGTLVGGVAATATILAAGSPDALTSSWITPAQLQSVGANVALAASRDLFVASGTVAGGNTLALGANTISLTAASNLVIDRGFTISAGGVSLNAGTITLNGGT